MNKKEIGEIIRISRVRKGLSQKKLAKMSRLQPQFISDWETGKKEPCGKNVMMLLLVLGNTLLQELRLYDKKNGKALPKTENEKMECTLVGNG